MDPSNSLREHGQFKESSERALYHIYLGYLLRVQGQIGEEQGEFLIAIGKAAQAKH